MTTICKVLGAAGLLTVSVCAQDQPAAAKTGSAQTVAPEQIAGAGHLAQTVGIFNKASSVIGMAVQDSSGKNIGKVQDLVLDLENSRLGYAVLALDKDRLVPVPVTALKPSQNKEQLVLNMSPALLAAASSVKNDNWPAVDAFAVGGPAGSETGHGSSSSSAQ